MTGSDDAAPTHPAQVAEIDPEAERILTALLAIDPATAAAARAETPARRRPRPQHGPVADFGNDAPPP